MICIECKEEFSHLLPRHKSKGKINECADCAIDVAKTRAVINGVGKTDVRLILQRNPQKGINQEVVPTNAPDIFMVK